MSNRTNSPRTTTRKLPRDARAEQILEFVYNDEEEALCNEEFVLSHQGEMPAVEEFLQEMNEFDPRPAVARWH